jgi:hypothetical protein
VGEIRSAFLASADGVRLHAYLDAHEALLPALVEREGVQVHGGLAALVQVRERDPVGVARPNGTI